MYKKLLTIISLAACVLLSAANEKVIHIDFESPNAQKDATGKVALRTLGTPEVVPGVVGNALFFDGKRESVRSLKKVCSFKENESFTIEFYIKPDRNPGKYWASPAFINGLRFTGRPHINSPFLFMAGKKKQLIIAGTGTGDFNTGKWCHIGLIRDAGNRTISYYCNGKRVALIKETPEMTAIFAQPSEVFAGARGWIYFYRGAIDELIVWKGIKKFDLSQMEKKNVVKQPPVKIDPRVAASWKILKEKKISLVPAPKQIDIVGKDFPFKASEWSVVRKNPADKPGYEVFVKRLALCKAGKAFSETGKKRIIAGLAKDVAKELSKKVKQPPREGYVLEVTPQKIVICGTDDNGLRYGWLTLAALLRENGKMVPAFVRDYPDFGLRFGHYSPERYSEAALKNIIDEIFLLRLNCLTTCQIMGLQKLPDYVARINAYAAERGIMCGFTGVPSVEDIKDARKKIPKGQDSHSFDYRTNEGMFGWKTHAISWSRDDLAIAQAKRMAEYMKKYNFTLVILHPVDAGGIDNPCRWNSRSPLCRKKWGNDFHAAQEHLMGVYCDTLKKYAPGRAISYVAYPYTPRMLVLKEWQGHLKRLEKRLGKDVMMLVREGVRKDMETLQKTISNFVSDLYPFSYDHLNIHCNGARYFCTFYTDGLNSKTGYEIWAPAGPVGHASRYTYTEYMWNAFAPGAKNMGGGISNSFKWSHCPEIEDELLPRICAWVYGERAAEVMGRVFAAKLSLRFGEHPFKVLPISMDHEKFFAEEAAVTDKLVADMQKIRPYIPAARVGAFTSFYLYVFRCRQIFHARLHCIRAHKFADEGKVDLAKSEMEKGLKLLNHVYVKNLPAAKVIRKEINIDEKLKSGSLKRQYVSKQPPLKAVVGFYQYVGTGSGDAGASITLMQAYDKVGGLRTVAVSDPTEKALGEVDVMTFVATKYVGDTTEDWRKNIRNMVEKDGKGVIFIHNAIGRERLTNLGKQIFPEICSGYGGRAPARRTLTVVDDTHFRGFLKKGDSYTELYLDHLIVIPGKNGKVLLRDNAGNAVAVVGKVGKGFVVYTGELFGMDARDGLCEPPFENWKMLYHLIRYAAGQ